jgi:hypothetical protein
MPVSIKKKLLINLLILADCEQLLSSFLLNHRQNADSLFLKLMGFFDRCSSREAGYYIKSPHELAVA